MDEILAIIPARGGSKSIPKKNITPLCGKPLIAHVIEALKVSMSVDRIIVTTDDEEIKNVSIKYGAEVPFLRPASLSQDTSRVFDALSYSLEKLDEIEQYRPRYIVTVQPTSPLIRPADIQKAVQLAVEKKADSVVSVETLPHRYHPHNIRTIQDGRTRFWMEKEHYEVINRQQRPTFYAFGNLYVSSYQLLRYEKRLEGKNNFSVPVDAITALDVDSLDDLKLIELIMKNNLHL